MKKIRRKDVLIFAGKHNAYVYCPTEEFYNLTTDKQENAIKRMMKEWVLPLKMEDVGVVFKGQELFKVRK